MNSLNPNPDLQDGAAARREVAGAAESGGSGEDKLACKVHAQRGGERRALRAACGEPRARARRDARGVFRFLARQPVVERGARRRERPGL